MLGSQSTIAGKAITNAIDTRSQIQKGIEALKISSIVVSGGATPFITNRTRPKGGEIGATSR